MNYLRLLHKIEFICFTVGAASMLVAVSIKLKSPLLSLLATIFIGGLGYFATIFLVEALLHRKISKPDDD